MNDNIHHINILGTTLNIKSGESSEYLGKVIQVFNAKIEEVKQNVQSHDPLKIALLSGLNLADELLKERQKQRKTTFYESSEIEKITERIIERLDEELT